jgi:L-rhamnose mutarotase
MEASIIQYTVKEDYVETNKANIKAVMAELRSLGDKGIKYSVFIKEDGKSFVHFVVFRDEEASNVIPNLESFKKFREQLQTGAVVKPVAEELDFIDSHFEFFT